MNIDAGIIAAIISGVAAVIVAIVNTNNKFRDLLAEIKTHNALQDQKIDTLTKSVEKHNQVVERTYHLEQDMAVVKSKLGES